jgi:hypothetical protein
MPCLRVVQSFVVFAAAACSNGTRGDGAGRDTGGSSGETTMPAAGVGGIASHAGGMGGTVGVAGAAGPSSGGNGATAGTGGRVSSDAGAAGAAAVAGTGDLDPDDALVWPSNISVMGLPGGHGVLEMFALTVRKGATHTEMYAAMKNIGDRAVCDAALTVELYDKDGQSVAAGIGGLLTQHLYRITTGDGAGNVAACVGPGEVTMASMVDLPLGLLLDDLGFAVYRNPYFGIEVEQIGELTVSGVESMTRGEGTAYVGTVVNGLDITVENPTVMIFPTNHVGRPLGMATGTGTAELPPGAAWTFETGADVAGFAYAAYATARTSDAGNGGQAGQAGQGGEASP